MVDSATSEAVPMTALDAVNMILRAIGASSVASLLSADMNRDAEAALLELTSTSREVQSRGWWFNTDLKYPIEPNGGGEIVLPVNRLSVDTVYTSFWLDLVERSGKLYDRRGHTFNIGEKVFVDLTVALPFEDLPAKARWYITVKAARRFAMSKRPDSTTYRYSAQDEGDAEIALEQEDSMHDDRTMATENPHVWKMRRR